MHESSESEAPIVIVDYDPDWPRQFQLESELLASALKRWLVGDLEHVGSTAVVGLVAKPIIDIMAPVRSLDASRPAIDAAATLSYCYSDYKSDAMHWFCKPSPRERTHHLHMVPRTSQLWCDRLAFRDALRANPELAKEYGLLKQELAAQYRFNRDAYTDAKSEFVHDVINST